MLTGVDIANYRGFKSYRLEGLSDVNLLVGKNNSGKTALLEGLHFLTSGAEPSVLAEIAQRRGELILSRPEAATLVEIGHFFHGHAAAPGSHFSLHGNNGYPAVEVQIVEAAVIEQKDLFGTTRPREFVLRVAGGRAREREGQLFGITRDGGVELEAGPRGRRFTMARKPEGTPVRFITTDFLTSAALAQMWDEITVGGLDQEVSEALRILDPDVRSVHMLSGMFAFGYVGSRAGVILGMEDQKTRIPLGSMGDGMRRFLVLASSLACATGGVLLIDEIDTGLHYSVMPDMWRLVIRKALAAGIQVFATTHSWDCIEGLSLLCQQERDLMPRVSIQKIDRAIPHSVPFSGESIVRMVKSDIDPR